MRRVITRLVGMAFMAIMIMAPLVAQNPVERKVLIRNIESKNASLSDIRTTGPLMQLRSDSKPFPEYGVAYSSTGEDVGKATFEYDASGNISTLMVYNRNGNDWVNNYKVVYEYKEAAEKETTYISYNWENNDWVNSEKNISVYDADGNRTLSESYDWNNNNWEGSRKTVTEYTNGEVSNEHYYEWVNNGWELIDAIYLPFGKKITYLTDDKKFYFGYPNANGGHASYEFLLTNKIETETDAKGNLVLFECGDYRFRMKYNDDNNPVSIEGLLRGGFDIKVNYEYDKNGYQTLFEEFDWIGDKWVVDYKIVVEYDAQGNLILYERHEGDEESNTWVLESRTDYKYDSNSNRIYYFDGSYCNIIKYDDKGNQLANYNYDLIDYVWKLSDYTIYYPNTSVLNAEVKNNTSVGDSNQGSFDIEVNISADDIKSGLLVVSIPEGFTLDEANTILMQEFVGNFELNITKQAGNSWLLEIKPKSANSAVQNTGEAATLLHIAYKTDEKMKQGDYNVKVSNNQFETTTDDMPIPTPAITFPVEVIRWGVSNEQVNTTEPNAYITNSTLYIETAQHEQVSVYNFTGSKFYETSVSEGVTAINAAAFPSGVLIIKGSSGWAKKVKN